MCDLHQDGLRWQNMLRKRMINDQKRAVAEARLVGDTDWLSAPCIKFARKCMWRMNHGKKRKFTGLSVCTHHLKVAHKMFNTPELNGVISAIEAAYLGLLHDCKEDYKKYVAEATNETVVAQTAIGLPRKDQLVHYLNKISDSDAARALPNAERFRVQFEIAMEDPTLVLAYLRRHDKQATMEDDLEALEKKPDLHFFKTRKKYNQYLADYAKRVAYIMKMPIAEKYKIETAETWSKLKDMVEKRRDMLPPEPENQATCAEKAVRCCYPTCPNRPFQFEGLFPIACVKAAAG